MKWLRTTLIGLLALFCLLVTADYLYDRTSLVNDLIADATHDLPMELSIGKVNHRFTQLGQLQLSDIKWHDQFGNSAELKQLQLKLNWQALLVQVIDIEYVKLTGLTINGHQQGVEALQSALAKTAEPAPENSDTQGAADNDFSAYIPTRLEVSEISLQQVDLEFSQAQQTYKVAGLDFSTQDLRLQALQAVSPMKLAGDFTMAVQRLSVNAPEQAQTAAINQLDVHFVLQPNLQITDFVLATKSASVESNDLFAEMNRLDIVGQFSFSDTADTLTAQALVESAAELEINLNSAEVYFPQQAQNQHYKMESFSFASRLAEQNVDIENLAFDTFGGQVSLAGSSNVQLPLDIRLNHLDVAGMDIGYHLAKPQASDESVQPADDGDSSQQDAPKPTDNQKIEQIANLYLESIELEHINIRLFEQENWLEAEEFNLKLKDTDVIKQHQLVDTVSLNAGAHLLTSLKRLKYISSEFSQINLNVTQTEDALLLADTGLTHKDGRVRIEGKVIDGRRVGESQAQALLQTDIYKFDLPALEPFLQSVPFKPTGVLDANLDLQLQLEPNNKWTMSKGDFNLKTGTFGIDGIALDKLINGFKASQETSLLDVGSFLVAGPVGMMAMQFAELSAGAAQFKGSSNIEFIQAKASVENNLIEVESAKVKTTDNRLGFVGNINLNEQAFEKFRFAILNEQDCPKVQQTLDGKFTEVKKVLFSTTSGAVTSPLSNVWRKAKDVAAGGCKSFYQ
ncbi:hypothetical protein DS2_05355 [Catenovulum agarivorans DS-2]|uniref:AsmA family protein n=1 Tax=Catenovulum agarivorans DS-2 TaxID=1328313 RepID=W7QTU2_9ALTE|nr:hypothetical protein [Catenovulum agarivorans]EWH11258.1 hypothetical protein DS2_05355 [Catenovulum agarivorans DS-2]